MLLPLHGEDELQEPDYYLGHPRELSGSLPMYQPGTSRLPNNTWQWSAPVYSWLLIADLFPPPVSIYSRVTDLPMGIAGSMYTCLAEPYDNSHQVFVLALQTLTELWLIKPGQILWMASEQ